MINLNKNIDLLDSAIPTFYFYQHSITPKVMARILVEAYYFRTTGMHIRGERRNW